MRILLTGGTGYIGSHTAVVLAQAGFNVTLFDNLCNSQYDVVNRITKITGEAITFVEGDVRDTQLVSATLKKHNINGVVHLAGLKSVADSVKNPIDYFSTNVHGSISLLQAMKQNDIKKLIFSSSATVYGVPRYLPYDEDHPTSAINPYGRSKLLVEEILRSLTDSDPFWSVVVLRYFNPVGAHESATIGELSTGTPNNLMPYLVQVASGRLSSLNVFGNDYPTADGSGERDFIHVMDIAEGHLAALNFVSHEKGWQAINLGTGQPTSVLQLVRKFESITHQKIPLKMTSRRSGDLPISYANSAKAKELLGWEAKRNIEDMCLSAWAWEDSRRS